MESTDIIVENQVQHELYQSKSSSCSSLYSCIMLVRKAPDNPQTRGRDTSKQASSRWMDGQIRYHLQVTGTKEEGRPSPVQGQLSPVEAKRDDSFAAAATQVIPYQVGGIAAKRETHQCFAASKPLMQTASFHVTLFHNRDSQDTHI